MGAAEDNAALASLGIQVNVTPFNWGDSSKHDATSSKKSRADLLPYSAPSGLDSLTQFVNSNNHDDGNNKTKDLLRTLLERQNVNISSNSIPSTDQNKESRYNQLLLSGEVDNKITSRDVSIRGLSDRAVAELTCESKTSLFGSILRLFDMDRDTVSKGKNSEQQLQSQKEKNTENKDSVGSIDKRNEQQQQPQQQFQLQPQKEKTNQVQVQPQSTQHQHEDPMISDEPILTTAEIVRSVHLTAGPGDIPPGMDSKEFTLAALHFLSSHVPFISENESDYRRKDSESSSEGWEMLRQTLPVLPLIKAINPQESLEKRSYGRVKPLVALGQKERKTYPDSISHDLEFRRKVLNLDRIFTSSLPFSKKDEFEPYVFQKYMPRRKLVPRIEGGGAKEELTLMISGHMQQPHNHTQVSKPKAGNTSSHQTPMPTPAVAAKPKVNVPVKAEKSSQSDAKPSSLALNTYMEKWVETHKPINLMPSLQQKETIIKETGVDKKRLESWFYRARKKMKRSQADTIPTPVPPVTKAYSNLLNAANQAQQIMLSDLAQSPLSASSTKTTVVPAKPAMAVMSDDNQLSKESSNDSNEGGTFKL